MSRLVAFEDIITQDGRPYIGIRADDDSRWLIRVMSNGVSSYPVASIDDGLKVRTVGIDVADAATMEAVCSSYNSGITPFEDYVSVPPAGMEKPYLLRLTSSCAWDRSGIASLVVEDGQENVIFNSETSPSTVFSEEAVESVEEITFARYVDMGLPSGLLWATCNVDATKPGGMTENEFIYKCSFFSWGNTVRHDPISDYVFGYDWGSVNAQAPWYEGQPYGSTPGAELMTDITPENDAARVICGEPWRMPTASEFQELFDNIDYLNADGTIIPDGETEKRITLNGINGIWIQSKINGNRLFFACSGRGQDTSWVYRSIAGYYWTASLESSRNSLCMRFGTSGFIPEQSVYRYYGFAVRPVRERSRRRRKESEDESEDGLEISKNESEQRQVVSENKSKRRKKVSKNESKQSQEK